MPRAFVFICDSFGIGHAHDAAAYGDEGANTYGHILEAAADGKADRAGLRSGPLSLPTMDSLGMDRAAAIAAGRPEKSESVLRQGAFFGAAQEISNGKDTPSGHWEITGVPVPFDWGYFPQTEPTFPADLTRAIVEQGKLPGILGDRHGSGTEVIDTFGEEHIQTCRPICYTSADSVIQIAAHEQHFGLERLYELCKIVRRLVDPLNIGRVIARPFVGERVGEFKRTANRRDFAVPPPEPTLLDRVIESGGRVIAMGKIGDIFAHRGISEVRKGASNMALFDKTLTAMDDARDGDLVFANFVDFDTEFGHRRDVAGYAAALEAFDRRLPEALAKMRGGDLLLVTADHGCDPTHRGNDHTRERVPIIGMLSGGAGGPAGLRPSFSDIGETVAAHLELTPGRHGKSFLEQISSDA